jgi:hypothetical protein
MRGPTHIPKRARRRKTGGRDFRRGENSHAGGGVFRRGPDRIPRGAVETLYRALLDDDGALASPIGTPTEAWPMRAQLARALYAAVERPRLAPIVADRISIRLEGRPPPIHPLVPRRVTTFVEAQADSRA